MGVMLDNVRVNITLRLASSWNAEGPLADRALGIARSFVRNIQEIQHESFHITVEDCPLQHAGFGVGTAMSLSIGHAIVRLLGLKHYNHQQIARMLGRGDRSSIGVLGFDQGGFIIDCGKQTGEVIAPAFARYRLPSAWHFYLINPGCDSIWFGDREQESFGRLQSNNNTDWLCSLIMLRLVPALLQSDLPSFGEAIHEYNYQAGACFANVQGGNYSYPVTADLIAKLRKAGFPGVGQSSWGPTVFVVVDEESGSRLSHFLDQLGLTYFRSQMNESGARIETRG